MQQLLLLPSMYLTSFFPPSWIIHCLISATPQTLAVSARNLRNSWLLSHCVAFFPEWSTALLSLFNISAVLMFHVLLPSLSVPHRQIQAHDVSFTIKVHSRRTDSRQGCKWRVVGLSSPLNWVHSYLLSGTGVKRWWECTLVPAGTLLDRTIQRLCTVVKIIWSLHPFIYAVAHFISQQQRLDSRRKKSWAFFLYWKVDLIWLWKKSVRHQPHLSTWCIRAWQPAALLLLLFKNLRILS